MDVDSGRRRQFLRLGAASPAPALNPKLVVCARSLAAKMPAFACVERSEGKACAAGRGLQEEIRQVSLAIGLSYEV